MKIIKRIISLVLSLVFINSMVAQTSDFELIGRWGEGACEAVEVDEEYIFMGVGTYIDIYENNQNYNFINRIITPGIIEDILRNENYLYIANDQFGLRIFEIADINNPKEIASLQLPGITHRIKLYNNHIYTANYSEGVRIINVEDPYNPVEVAFYRTGAMVINIVLKDNYLYSTQNANFDILDISTPSTPVFIRRLSTFLRACWDLAIKDNYLFVQTWDRDLGSILYSWSIKDLINPVIKSAVQVDGWVIGLADTLAYVSMQWTNIKIVNISNPDSIFFLTEFDTYGYKNHIKSNNDLIFVADGHNGLLVINAIDTLTPIIKHHFHTPGNTSFLVADNDFVYLSNHGLRILDVSNPTTISVIGSLPTIYFTEDIYKKDNLIFLVDYNIGGIRIINVEHPNNPQEITQINIFEDVVPHILLSYDEDNLYIKHDDSLGIWNISNPLQPFLVTTLKLQGWCWNLLVVDTLLITSQGPGELVIYNIANPSVPNFISSLNIQSDILYLAVQSNYIIGSIHNGIVIIDISDPNFPVEKLFYPQIGYPYGIEANNNYLYIAKAERGITITDIKDILNPKEVGNFDTQGTAWSLDAVDDKIFIADSRYGMPIVQNNLLTDISEQTSFPFSFELFQNYPNPFNPSTRIQFSISSKEFVKIKVYDVLGKEIETFINEEKPAGNYEVEFDGSNLSSGVYFYSLIVNDVVQNKKMILLK